MGLQQLLASMVTMGNGKTTFFLRCGGIFVVASAELETYFSVFCSPSSRKQGFIASNLQCFVVQLVF